MNKYIPKIFTKRSDGGDKSGVTAFFIIEWKAFFSIAVLKFNRGSREAYHSHAFNALTWWLKGHVIERDYFSTTEKVFTPSLIPKLTLRNKSHKIIAQEVTYALTFRGPWSKTWTEYVDGKATVLTHGRVKLK